MEQFKFSSITVSQMDKIKEWCDTVYGYTSWKHFIGGEAWPANFRYLSDDKYYAFQHITGVSVFYIRDETDAIIFALKWSELLE